MSLPLSSWSKLQPEGREGKEGEDSLWEGLQPAPPAVDRGGILGTCLLEIFEI